ncbi:MAG: EAL domain-containing protein [Acidaminococcaceae bacterium]|jgi:diguanylate cyclase (GGDEF)-like protein|nr:EAL domain-containing protein [Acidaminococcaceae bacterium]
MAAEKRKVLIIDDMQINRKMLHAILASEYEVLEADDGDTGLETLRALKETISLIILDLVMPRMNGYKFLELKQKDPEIMNVPVLVMTADSSVASESRCLQLGALDFLVKPYNGTIILQRARNIIGLRENTALRNTLERDSLTGLYNREAFMQRATEFLHGYEGKKACWVLVGNLEKFKVVNAVYGHQKGDELLQYIAECFRQVQQQEGFTGLCARMAGDNYACCCAASSEANLVAVTKKMIDRIQAYPIHLHLTFQVGVYKVESLELPVNAMYDLASLALQEIKGKYGRDISIYDEKMRDAFVHEQELAEEMLPALKNEEFKVYYQGKYNLTSGELIGAEALSRWQHPKYGLLTPNKFIQTMEKNGIISMLDFYVAEHACRDLRRWIEEGHESFPVSVNISRIDVYNLDLVQRLQDLMHKYDLPLQLLELEFTETAYTQDSNQMVQMANALKAAGFNLAMDDFGSGYSSLNLLGDVPFDVVKLDMHFLKISQKERQREMLSFAVDLVKRMGITLLAEGIETEEEAAFLRSMGCNQGQGYYFAKPLERSSFEQLFTDKRHLQVAQQNSTTFANITMEAIYNPNSSFNLLFNAYVGALGIFEIKGKSVSAVRCNDMFLKLYKKYIDKDGQYFKEDFISFILPEDRPLLFKAIDELMEKNGEVNLDVRVKSKFQKDLVRWVHIKAKMLYHDAGNIMFLGSFDDITDNKNRELELRSREEQFIVAVQNARNVIMRYDPLSNTIEIYGSHAFANNYTRLEIHDAIDELVRFHRWNEKAYAQWQAFFKQIHSGGESGQKMFAFVDNLDKQTFYDATFQNQYDTEHKLVKTLCVFKDVTESKEKELSLLTASRREALTGLLNRHAFEEGVNNMLEHKDLEHFDYAFGMLDMDDFKSINDEKGHFFGDEVLVRVAEILSRCFRSHDLVARMGGDEFAFFVALPKNTAAMANLEKRVRNAFMHQGQEDDIKAAIECSIGISHFTGSETFDDLYTQADKAMYNKKNDKE